MGLSNTIKAGLTGGAIAEAYGSPFKGDVISVGDRWKVAAPTQLTLATCEAVLEDPNLSGETILKRFIYWFQRGRLTGLDPTTYRSLQIEVLGDKAGLNGEEKREPDNGAAIRVAPLAFLIDPTTPSGKATLREVVEVTHPGDEAYAGALAIVLAHRFIQNDLNSLWGNLIKHLPDTRVRSRLIQMGRQRRLSIREVAYKYGASSKVSESVPLAIYAAHQVRETGFRPMIKALVAAGGDTNANCSMAAQIACLVTGNKVFPKEWVDSFKEIHSYPQYEKTLHSFSQLVQKRQGIQTLF